MELTTVKELFSDREKYLDKEVPGGRLDPQHPRLESIRLHRIK